ncbi:hypothetical protein R6Q57_010136 [Mikania cordata]
MWVVKRKRGNVEYYESPLDFEPWTCVDLAELDEAPFFNRSNDPRGSEFYDFLHEETFTLSWPPTNKLRSIPIPLRFHHGNFSNFVMWAIDSESSETVINCGDHEYRILDKNDLLRFACYMGREWELSLLLGMRPWSAVAYSAPVVVATDVFLIYPIGQ